MAFNGPGKSPWEKNPQPNLDEFLSQLRNRLKGRFNLFNIWVVLAIIVAIWAASGFYKVETGELGVVRRFGEFITTTDPGLSYRIPWPVDQVDKIQVEQIRSMELGFRSSQQSPSGIIRPVLVESLMITGDENLVNIQVVVQYRISDPTAYLFKVWDAQGRPDRRTLRDAAETALRGVAGEKTIDNILTVGRAEVQDLTRDRLQELLDLYQTGLLVTAVKLQAVDPPEPVQASFKDVNIAKEDRERIINESKAYREDLLPKARGEAQQMLRAAEAYRETKIREAQGDTARFLSMLKEYRAAKEVTRTRLYLETMGEVLSKVKKMVVSPEVGSRALPLLPLTEASIPAALQGTTPGGSR